MFKTADYLANKTSIKKHKLKTLYELIIGTLLDLCHLQRTECKTYPLNKNIPRKIKLQKRAYIDYLIGYKARNIFRVWISNQRKIIRTRDVLLNDTADYDTHEINLMQVIEKPMLKITFDALNLKYYTRVFKIEKNEKEKQKLNMLALINEDSQAESKKMQYLSTPSSSEFSINVQILTSFCAFSVAPFSSAHIDISIPMPLSSCRMIGLNLDETNILPKKIGRRKIPRRQAYLALLIDASNGEISSYYAAFAAFSKTSQFYETFFTAVSKILVLNLGQLATRAHRDHLSAESKNVC